jgi:queuine/archaeosine tRNA-ribosyltransferase
MLVLVYGRTFLNELEVIELKHYKTPIDSWFCCYLLQDLSLYYLSNLHHSKENQILYKIH